MLFLIPFFFKMKTPEETGFLPEHKTTPALHSRSISRTLEYCLCLFIFIYVGVECAYGGWIPSFVVLTGVTDHTGATKFPSLFWVLLTMFRFLLAFAPGSSSKKLKILIEGIVLTGIFSLGLIYAGHLTLACYLSGVFFGLSMSSVFPLVFTFPIEEGLVIEDAQATNIGIASVVA
jgi:fucose permease